MKIFKPQSKKTNIKYIEILDPRLQYFNSPIKVVKEIKGIDNKTYYIKG